MTTLLGEKQDAIDKDVLLFVMHSLTTRNNQPKDKKYIDIHYNKCDI